MLEQEAHLLGIGRTASHTTGTSRVLAQWRTRCLKARLAAMGLAREVQVSVIHPAAVDDVIAKAITAVEITASMSMTAKLAACNELFSMWRRNFARQSSWYDGSGWMLLGERTCGSERRSRNFKQTICIAVLISVRLTLVHVSKSMTVVMVKHSGNIAQMQQMSR